MNLLRTVEDLVSKYTNLHKRCRELERQRNVWLMRAVAMAGPDDLAQWAREGGSKDDIYIPGGRS